MGWISILMALLPLFLKLLEWFQNRDPKTLTDRQKVKLGQLRTACQRYEGYCQEKGISAEPIPSGESLEEE